MVAALFVETNGCYFGLPDVDPWDVTRDARTYAGPHPVVAHPPCERWGRFFHGSTRKPHQFKLGDDDGCFEAALRVVRTWGGVLEHPEASQAWRRFNLTAPPRDGGWVAADFDGGWTCCVEQGFYGHFSNKATWLYACKVDLPSLRWGRGEQRLHPTALAKHGYEKARRIGMVAMIGGKDKKKIRDRTPIEFRDLLISIAQSSAPQADDGAPPRASVLPGPAPSTPLVPAHFIDDRSGFDVGAAPVATLAHTSRLSSPASETDCLAGANTSAVRVFS